MPLEVGLAAPDFELSLQSGGSHSLARLNQAGPLLLCFVKTPCPTCRFTLPLLNDLHDSLGRPESSIAVIAQEAAPAATRLVAELGLEIPVLLDEAPYAVSRAYGIKFVPTFCLIDDGGRIEHVSESFAGPDLEAVHGRLSAALGCPCKPFHDGEALPAFLPG